MLARIAVKQSRTFVTRTAPKRGGDGVHYVFNTKEKRFSAATSIAVIGGGCLFGTVSALVVMTVFFLANRWIQWSTTTDLVFSFLFYVSFIFLSVPTSSQVSVPSLVPWNSKIKSVRKTLHFASVPLSYPTVQLSLFHTRLMMWWQFYCVVVFLPLFSSFFFVPNLPCCEKFTLQSFNCLLFCLLVCLFFRGSVFILLGHWLSMLFAF